MLLRDARPVIVHRVNSFCFLSSLQRKKDRNIRRFWSEIPVLLDLILRFPTTSDYLVLWECCSKSKFCRVRSFDSFIRPPPSVNVLYLPSNHTSSLRLLFSVQSHVFSNLTLSSRCPECSIWSSNVVPPIIGIWHVVIWNREITSHSSRFLGVYAVLMPFSTYWLLYVLPTHRAEVQDLFRVI